MFVWNVGTQLWIYESHSQENHIKLQRYINKVKGDFYTFDHACLFHSSAVCFIIRKVNVYSFDGQVINFWKTQRKKIKMKKHN
jgi:hypothetical protein